MRSHERWSASSGLDVQKAAPVGESALSAEGEPVSGAGAAQRMAARQCVPHMWAAKGKQGLSQPDALPSRPPSRGALEPFRETPQSSSEPDLANAACSMTADPRPLPPRRVTTAPRTACNAADTMPSTSSTRPANVATSFRKSTNWALNALLFSRRQRSRASKRRSVSSIRLLVSSKRLSIRRLL